MNAMLIKISKPEKVDEQGDECLAKEWAHFSGRKLMNIFKIMIITVPTSDYKLQRVVQKIQYFVCVSQTLGSRW